MAFAEAHPSLVRALVARDYAEPTPVQAAVMNPDTAGRDLVVSAQTGSGKTVAYGLAIASTLLGSNDWFDPAGAPLALVIAPTRELALQVHRELSWLYAEAGARVVSLVGGMDIRRERRALAEGAHIAVGTPGRLRDHLEKGFLDPTRLAAVVLDEADEMLDLGFRDDLEAILDATPAERRTLLFSATLPKPIVALARTYQRDAMRIDVTVQGQPHADIGYRAIRVAPNEVESTVVNVLRFHEAPAAIVFCSTRDAVKHLYASLLERGFAVVALSGELSQHDRTQALQSIRDGRARVCVATDVAARGIDLPDLGLVIHADLPNDAETMLHRSGRTGRAGKKGVSVLIVPYTRRRKADLLIATAKVKVDWGAPPSADEIRALDQARMLADPVLTEPLTEEDMVLGRALLDGRSAEDVAAALVRLYRSRLPEPEELFDAGPAERGGPERRGRADRAGPDGFDRAERRPRDAEPPARLGPADVVWFRMNVGRNRNADPRWLLPLICRVGHVTKRDIGAIRIFDRETKFEIAKAVAAKFAGAVAKSGDEEVVIEAIGGEGGSRPARPSRETAAKGFDRPRSEGDRPRGDADRPGRSRSPRAEGERPAPASSERPKRPQKPGKRERSRKKAERERS